MDLYMCSVFDGRLGELVNVGVFSTEAKAYEGGSLYIIEAAGEVSLLDWENDDGRWVSWYQSKNGLGFTRIVTKAKLDERMV